MARLKPGTVVRVPHATGPTFGRVRSQYRSEGIDYCVVRFDYFDTATSYDLTYRRDELRTGRRVIAAYVAQLMLDA